MSRRSSNKKRCVCCPACGDIVFKGTLADTEQVCKKCGANIGAWVMDGVVVLYDPKGEGIEETTVHRLSSYLESISKR